MNINSNYYTVIQIIEDGACLFRSLSYVMNMNHNEEGCYHIRQSNVLYVIENWDRFAPFSENHNGDNYPDSRSYYTHISQHATYGGFIELPAARELYSYIFEVHRNSKLYEDFGNNDNPTKRFRFTGALS